jgi:hypothetical protein
MHRIPKAPRRNPIATKALRTPKAGLWNYWAPEACLRKNENKGCWGLNPNLLLGRTLQPDDPCFLMWLKHYES